jgi:hypothetical protein
MARHLTYGRNRILVAVLAVVTGLLIGALLGSAGDPNEMKRSMIARLVW